MYNFEWIDLKRQKPDIGDTVWMYSPIGDIQGSMYIQDENSFLSFTHWAKLPNPPTSHNSECTVTQSEIASPKLTS